MGKRNQIWVLNRQRRLAVAHEGRWSAKGDGSRAKKDPEGTWVRGHGGVK